MKKILLTTDFSKNATNAIEYALQLFKNQDCTFYVLNVQKQNEFILDDLMSVPANASVHQAIVKDNKKELAQFVAGIEKRFKNETFVFKPLFDFDNLIHAIDEVVKSNAIDLIVIGTNGATSAKEVVFGSNTLNVIRKIKCPVLAIPENYTFNGIGSVLFSTENCKDFKKEGIKPLNDILTTHEAFLSVLDLGFTDDPDMEVNNSSCLNYLFESQKYQYYSVKNVPSVMAISTAIQLFDYDMHALFVEQKSFIERFIFGSNTDDISYNTLVPLLVLRNK